MRHFVPAVTLITLYKSLIQPYLMYGISAWGQACESYLNKLLLLQKRALRLIYFADRKDSAVPLFQKTNILPVNFLYLERVSILMYDVTNDIAPPNICNVFTSISSIHSYNTRSSASNKLYLQYSRTNIQKKSFSRFGTQLWNQIPKPVRELPKTLFKKKIKQSFFNDLINFGYDAEISNLFKFKP